MKKFMKPIVLFAAVLLFALGIRWKFSQPLLVWTNAEIVEYYPQSNSVLATTAKEGGLFTFSMPKENQYNATGDDLTQCGTIVSILGPDEWSTSYPMQYKRVIKVKYVSKREDFVSKYKDDLVKQHRTSTREKIEKDIEDLKGLNEGEKEALKYLVLGELGLWQ